ncbi:MAG: hypothetical protein ACYDAS_00095 [Patescibacteria group bacterium]
MEIQQLDKRFDVKQQESSEITTYSYQTQTIAETSLSGSPIMNGDYDKLNQLFRDQNKEQLVIREAREILGSSSEDLTDEEVYNLVTNVQYLVDSWLEEFERGIFNGKTLNELLHF